jgi:hypothetical protein
MRLQINLLPALCVMSLFFCVTFDISSFAEWNCDKRIRGEDLGDEINKKCDEAPGGRNFGKYNELFDQRGPGFVMFGSRLIYVGAVLNVVGIRCGAISGNMKVSFQAARSIG